jgi:hypothetical protein
MAAVLVKGPDASGALSTPVMVMIPPAPGARSTTFHT